MPKRFNIFPFVETELGRNSVRYNTLACMFPDILSSRSFTSSSSAVCFFIASACWISKASFSLLELWSSLVRSLDIFSKSLSLSWESRTALYISADFSETLVRASSTWITKGQRNEKTLKPRYWKEMLQKIVPITIIQNTAGMIVITICAPKTLSAKELENRWFSVFKQSKISEYQLAHSLLPSNFNIKYTTYFVP